jgi:diacylglycerol kinase (ATP)
MKKKLKIIINPFSGIGKKKVVPFLLEKILDKNLFEWDITYTEKAKHAIDISADAVKDGYQGVIAVGGDGSVNEIARSLIHTDVVLGIIPGGSGNGIARSLNIPIKTIRAIENINQFYLEKIDTGLLDGHPFIGVAGLGFDALISKEFAERRIRGKLGYGYVILKKMNAFKPMNVAIDGISNMDSNDAIVVAFANTSQYGNNAFIAPTANPFDGQLKISLIEKLNLLQFADISQKMFRRKLLESKKVQFGEFNEITIKHGSKYAHIDGEPIEVPSEIVVKVVPLSLNVISPSR